ncbi:hypothetical protein B9479_006700 [Cryptococcus floricola]|uniref:Uncharacterized protein n=1 Tax=Cryptococcus floricola TaxID=2591691 RepID=A0A5D3APC4_9TREE|nr:hypothetical protein B9479_006700 [Cryptococcus floricola]
MLPTHNPNRRPRPYFAAPSPSLSSPGTLLNLLRQRTRLTNLAAALLVTVLSGSLLLNLNYILFPSTSSSPRSFSYKESSGWDDSATPDQLESPLPLSLETTIERDPRYAEIDRLIMVPGHAIWLGEDASTAGEDNDWILEPMQKGGSVKTYIKHIEKGVEELENDPNSLLVFSGGATRHPPSPPTPEALSYHRLASALSLLPSTPIADAHRSSPLPTNLRTATEEYALDSYQNLLFSIARFREVTGNWPKKITVVGYGMKRKRFQNLHRAAIQFPASAFEYIGIDDTGDTSPHYAGELKFGYLPFLSSPSGCHPPLSIKRLVRNPFFRWHPYFTSCPELSGLLEWCPPVQEVHGTETWEGREDEVGVGYPGAVPWKNETASGVTWGREKD